MKRFAVWMVALLILLAGQSGLAQETRLVEPLPVSAQMDALAGQTFVTIPLMADAQSRILSLRILEPEAFQAEDVEAIKPGDRILSGGKVTLVEQLESLDTGALVINPQEGIFTDNWLLLAQMENGQYQSTHVHDWVWHVVGEGSFSLSSDAQFWDWIDPDHGDRLEVPTVHTPEEWIRMFGEHRLEILLDWPRGTGFNVRNFRVTFDEKGEITLLERFYVEWQ